MNMNAKGPLLLSAAMTIALLAGCDSDGDDSPPNDDSGALAATLVVPIAISENPAQDFRNMAQFNARMSDCATVPAGYNPLAGVTVEFLDANGNVLGGPVVVTDDCGFFNTQVPAGTVSIRAVSTNNRNLVASISSIIASGGVASTIPADATYRVGFLSAYDDTTLGFTITDSVTNKAVIGLARDTFSVSVDGNTQGFTNITTGLTSEDASITMVTDSSGSMSTTAFTDENGVRYSRTDLATEAAHQFLNIKNPNDEVSMLIFGSRVNFIDQQTIDTLFEIEDVNGNMTTYPFTGSGFTRDSQQMRFIVDAYNRDSTLWNSANRVDTHPDTPALSITSRYPFGGSTAFYQASVDASNKLLNQPNPRKFILAMTDGENTSGAARIDDVITTANNNRTPVYTIGFASPNRTDLDRIATETGATYFQVTDLDLSDAYNSIQTNIEFQYVGTLANSTANASQIELFFDIDRDGVPEASRTIVNTPPPAPAF